MEISVLAPVPPPEGGGSAFNAGLWPAMRARGHVVREGAGPGVSEAGVPEAGLPVIDGMALPGLEAELEALLARDAVVVVHHLSAAAGRDREARQEVAAAEKRMLPRFRRVVATSAPVAERLAAEFGVAAPVVVHPGHQVLPRSVGGVDGCRIMSVGVLTPRKGHGRLLAALARLGDLPWTLVIAGDAGRDPAHAAELGEMAERLGLGERVAIRPEAEAAWDRADLFASATAWEGYPGAVAEAVRRGIPVVAPRLPGIEAVIPAAAGILYAADDAATFGKCLRRAVFDRELRAELADGAWVAGRALPGWDAQAAVFEGVLAG